MKKVIKEKGYTLHQIDRIGDVYIYQKKPDVEDWMSERDIEKLKAHYEVVKPVLRKSWGDDNPTEKYPSASDWGKNGFTVPTYARAVDKALELN